MQLDDPEHILTPDAQRLAELHLRARFGEVLNQEEVAALVLAQTELGACFAQLDATEAVLIQACAQAQPRPSFVARVLIGLPSKPTLVAPAQLFAAAPQGGSRRHWFMGAAAALVALGIAVALHYRLSDTSARDTGLAQVLRGLLTDDHGQSVTHIQAGESYRTGEGEVVVRLAQSAVVRLRPNTVFEALDENDRHALRLRKGELYAHGTGAQPLLVRAQAFDTEVEGVSWLLHEDAATVAPTGIVMVFHGQARVRTSAGQAHTVDEGELYVAGAAPESVEQFEVALQATIRNADLPVNREELQHERVRYASVVDGYRRDLKVLEDEITRAADSRRLAELKQRKLLVEDHLRVHRLRLDNMSREPEDGDFEHVRKLRRTLDRVREGRDRYNEPNLWM